MTANVLLCLGVAVILSALWSIFRGRPTRRARNPKTMLIVGAVALLLGGAIYRFGPVHPPQSPQPPIVSDSRIEDRGLLGFSLEAPAGWRLEYEPEKTTVRVFPAQGPAESGITLFIGTTESDEHTDSQKRVEAAQTIFSQRGFEVERSLNTSIGGERVPGFLSRKGPVSFATWMFVRSERIGTSIQCMARAPAEAESACLPVLEKLKWGPFAKH